MVESHWEGLRDRELRYRDRTWRLSGDLDVRSEGRLLAVEAKRADGHRGERARLYFGVEDDANSLNPGAMGEHFDRLERSSDGHHLVVATPGRTYRYELQRVEFE
jgi:hypothetical protein